MTVNRSRRTATLALLFVSLALGACSSPGTSSIASAVDLPSSATAEPSPAVVPSNSPSVERPSAEPPSAEPTSAEPPSAEPPIALPPDASIAVEGGDPVVGQLGSFTWENSGSDGPWLAGSPIHLGSGERLKLTLSEPVRLVDWTASRVAPGELSGSASVGLGEGPGGPVTFAAPPPGTWSVNVNVWFADNLGSAAYYWLMEID